MKHVKNFNQLINETITKDMYNSAYNIAVKYVNNEKNQTDKNRKLIDHIKMLMSQINTASNIEPKKELYSLLVSNGIIKTNEFLDFMKSKKMTDEQKFQKALDNAKPIIKQNYEEVFDEDKKISFYNFVKDNGFKIPQYFKYMNGKFVDATVNVGGDILATGSTTRARG